MLVSFTSKFTLYSGIGLLGIGYFICNTLPCNNLTRLPIFLSRFLESRNYKIQIVARVGRKSAVVLSGTMEASYPHFFIGQGFESSTTRKRQARRTCPNKTPIASGVEESNSPRRVLLLLLSDSSGGRFLKKKHVHV